MGTTALMIRAESADEMAKLLKLDHLMTLATAIADDTARSDIEMYAGVQFLDGVVWYDPDTLAEDVTPDRQEYARRAWAYIQARGAEAFPWQIVTDPARRLIRFVDKIPAAGVANG